MRAWGPKSAAYPAPAGPRRRVGPGLLALALLSAALAVDACGGKLSRGGTTSAVTGGTGGVGPAAPAGGGTNGDTGGTFSLGGASARGGAPPGGDPRCDDQGTCSHPYCSSGAVQDSTCSACAYAVCNRQPLCCAATWDENCMLFAQTYCGCDCGVGTGGTTGSGGAPTGGTATGGVWTVTGGTASGGTATGGSATGGTGPVPVCSTVASLPTMGTACSTYAESLCDASGNQCVCFRGIWNCTTSCASTYPVEPASGSPCVRGAACNYASGVSCSCLNSSWLCWGSGCPANEPVTGDACNGLTGVACDYPNQNPTFHFACLCTPNADASTGSTWTCTQSGFCPATQPAYDLTRTCPGTSFCGYGSTRCGCTQPGSLWICGLGLLVLPFEPDEPPPPGG